MKQVPVRPVHNESPLLKLMACRQLDDKLLHEPMLSQFSDA